ncbi:hypothetical protein DY000_02040808 [Brassica cretica]|uniref:Uncharacterized protein n=1 Tax=Brassica cretica TaxID=69181 RepID=A0ABQ7B5H2_BRACR|nr:hypothetical protein DY000_02040808 [Brassica cretica]
MVGEAHSLTLEARLSQHLLAIQKLNDKIAQLGKRNKPQGRPPPHGKRRSGDAPETVYVEPKPPDPSWITPHQTYCTHEYLTHPYLDLKYADDVKIYSFSRSSIVAGLKKQEFKREEPLGVTFVIDKKMVQDTKLSMLLKEAKPVIKVSHQDKCLTPPRDTSTDVWILDVWSKNESYMLTEVPRKEPYHKLSHKPPHKWKPKSEQWIVQIPRPMVSSMTDIIHLLLVQNIEIISSYTEESFKEIPPDNLLLLAESTPRETRNVATKIFKDHPPQNRCSDHFKIRCVILSHLLKEEPPDAPCITKPKLYQGKVLNSQKKMKPDLLYLGAGSPVLRSKLCQGKSVMRPSNQ